MVFAHRYDGPGIEQFVTDAALEAAAERQTAIAETAKIHGLADGSILVGSGGLAAHGLDAHMGDGSTFDFDTFVDDPTFSALQGIEGAESLPASRPTEVHVPAMRGALPVTGLKSPFHEGFAYVLGVKTIEALGERAVSVGGVTTLSPADLAHAKMAGRIDNTTDAAAIIKAHFIAHTTGRPLTETGRPLAEDPDWQWQVWHAVLIADRRAATQKRAVRRNLPWLGQLAANRFDYPAFTTLDTTPPYMRRAS